MLLFAYLVVSITALFYINLAKDKPLTLDTINNWVSLILGLVATIFSILSMWISFHSLDKSNEQNEENIKSMNALKEEILNKVERTNEAYLKEFYELKSKMDVTNSELNHIKDHVSNSRLNIETSTNNGIKDEYDVKEDLE